MEWIYFDRLGLLVSEDMAARIKTKEVDLETIVNGQLTAAKIVNDQRAALNPNQQSTLFHAIFSLDCKITRDNLDLCKNIMYSVGYS